MGVQSRRQVRAALVFVARPLLFAVILTAIVRIFLAGSDNTLKPLPNAESPKQKTADAKSKSGMAPEVADVTDEAAVTHQGKNDKNVKEITRALVVASTSTLTAADVAWLDQVPPEWQPVYNYVTDAPLSPDLAVPVNKGNEAMAYLTYIVDHYDALPDVVLFHHGHRRGWHQSMDSLEEVQRLRVEYVAKRGYVSLRCLPGCENVIVLADYAVLQSQLPRYGRDVQLTTLLDDFLDKDKGERVPVRLASPCCAQFAASRAAIQQRSRAWWQSLRQWLMETPLRSMDSGRLMEHTWHVWLGNESYHCPEKAACQCHTYGLGQCDDYFALEDAM